MSPFNWTAVARCLRQFAEKDLPISQGGLDPALLDKGQRASLKALARRIDDGRRAALLADEVGMGKTRIAVALIEAVRRCGGRSAIVLPAGLGAQWQTELQLFNPQDRKLLPLRSYAGFIEAYQTEDDWHRDRDKQWLRNRRLQRDLPSGRWSNEEILMISHSFANMRFAEAEHAGSLLWRRELLPAVRYFHQDRRRYVRQRGYVQNVLASHKAARKIVDIIHANTLPFDPNFEHIQLSAHEYMSRTLPLIGYALGKFDLVIIDEAHKSRGQDSSLSRILGPVTWESDDCFRLGMTATPVELDAGQWLDTLKRILGRDGDDADQSAHLGQAGIPAVSEAITEYVEVAKRLTTEPLHNELVESFCQRARRFQRLLSPYVLRRDKRDDPDYAEFINQHGDYRSIDDIIVSPQHQPQYFTHDWLRSFCVAEALSLVPQNDHVLKRLRLTFPAGHAVESINCLSGRKGENTVVPEEGEPVADTLHSGEFVGSTAINWLAYLGAVTPDIYTHPALLATIDTIERYTAKGEKVLVFGRYIHPLNSLTKLLNVREMLRRLRDGIPWPGKTLPDNSLDVLQAALRSATFASLGWTEQDIETRLEEQFQLRATRRAATLQRLRQEISQLASDDQLAAILLKQLQGSTGKAGEVNADELHEHDQRARLWEALGAHLSDPEESWTGASLIEAFRLIVSEIMHEEDPDEDQMDERLTRYLDDFSGREGQFARMLSGQTSAQTRRSLQAAFNRPGANPMVLVAQSMVGREGLNLHLACKTIILFHAEWNPGVVEQQIGRVDRKNSRWLRDVKVWEDAGRNGPAPRINIHRVIVQGTYDDQNWAVLKSRWKDLRAQLHGDVLPHLNHTSGTYSADKEAMIARIMAAAPRFSPLTEGEHSLLLDDAAP